MIFTRTLIKNTLDMLCALILVHKYGFRGSVSCNLYYSLFDISESTRYSIDIKLGLD